MTTGLVLGKFLPPHLGHLELAYELRGHVDDVIVLCLASRTEPISLEQRLRWLRDCLPWATVLGGYDEAPMGDTAELWDAHLAAIRSALGDRRIDLLLHNEWYGEGTAERLGAKQLSSDPERAVLSVSGTAVREDPAAWWWLLPAAVRATLVQRVVVLGSESTGSTTLARHLAAALGTMWVPEYGRLYSQAKGPPATWTWTHQEFDAIAAEQAALEDAAAVLSGPILVCDTDVLATAVWHEFLCRSPSPTVLAFAARRLPAAYILTSPDGVAWEDDGLREGEHRRAEMHARFRQLLTSTGVPWLEVTGGPQRRLTQARTWLAANVIARVATERPLR